MVQSDKYEIPSRKKTKQKKINIDLVQGYKYGTLSEDQTHYSTVFGL